MCVEAGGKAMSLGEAAAMHIGGGGASGGRAEIGGECL